MEEPLLHGRVVAVADRADHVPAVVAQVLGRLLPHDVPLVREESDEDEEENPDERADGPAREALLAERERQAAEVHVGRFRGTHIKVTLRVLALHRDVRAVSPSEVKRRLEALGVRATKALGQHFLVDERIAHRHVEFAGITANDVVLEIGPGLGVLTKRLLQRAANVVAVEADRRLASSLRELDGNLEVIQGDAVKVPLPAFDVVVSNLPYQISSPITFRLLDLPFRRAVLMYQEEFADRLVARRGDDGYSRLSVKAYVRARTEIIERVPRSAFWPPPKVDSAIVLLEPRAPPFAARSWTVYEAVVDASFQHRRKAIENALRLSWRRFAPTEDAFEALVSQAPHRRRRPEELTPEEFAELSDALSRKD